MCTNMYRNVVLTRHYRRLKRQPQKTTIWINSAHVIYVVGIDTSKTLFHCEAYDYWYRWIWNFNVNFVQLLQPKSQGHMQMQMPQCLCSMATKITTMFALCHRKQNETLLARHHFITVRWEQYVGRTLSYTVDIRQLDDCRYRKTGERFVSRKTGLWCNADQVDRWIDE